MTTEADVAIYGGAAGGGKTFAICLDAVSYVGTPGYGAIIFRRTTNQLRGAGSILAETRALYPSQGGTLRESPAIEWRFPSGATIEMGHLQFVKDVLAHQGKQYTGIYLDQLEQFEAEQFWFLLARNRSVCGIRPFIRGTANPDPDCFLYENGDGFISWWIDPETGLPDPERDGVLRWFVRVGGKLEWASSPEPLFDVHGIEPLSATFIAASLDDNPALNEADPGYRSRLQALTDVDRERLLGGNWKVKPTAGNVFRRDRFEVVDDPPPDRDVIVRARCWDLAATKPSKANADPDWSRGALVSKTRDGSLWIEDMASIRDGPAETESFVLATAQADGRKVRIGFWQDPGAAGKKEADRWARLLSGFTVSIEVARENKITYANPVASAAKNGIVRVVRGAWLSGFLSEAESFPDGAHDDQIDAVSRAWLMLDAPLADVYRALTGR